MKWIEAKVVFDHPDNALATDLVSDAFYELGLQGVVVDDPDIEPEENWAENAVGRPAQHAVSGYFPKDSRVQKRCKTLEAKLQRLQKTSDLLYRISYKELDEEDWAHSWKAYFWPRKIGRRIVVKPTWREYEAGSDDIVIDLDPGMAFGTGTHPTTELCVKMIEKYLSRGDSFLDVGTGSGILMITAAKLGAGRLDGIDKDETAVAVAAKNLELNSVKPQQARLRVGNLVDGVDETYHFIVANIFTHVIIMLLEDITKVLKDSGMFVCSGIIEENKNLVTAAMRDAGFEILEVAVKEAWAAIAGRLRCCPQNLKPCGRIQ